MRTFIWRNTAPITNRYHDDGGLLVTADTVHEARATALRHLRHLRRDSNLDRADWLTDEPDYDYPSDTPSMVIVFPDAGCC